MDSTIIWHHKKQLIIFKNFTISKYINLSNRNSKAIWLKSLSIEIYVYSPSKLALFINHTSFNIKSNIISNTLLILWLLIYYQTSKKSNNSCKNKMYRSALSFCMKKTFEEGNNIKLYLNWSSTCSHFYKPFS